MTKQQTAVAQTAPATSEPVLRPVFHHVNLKTTRLDEMIEWYGVVVGARANSRHATGAWLTNDDANHRIALLTLPALRDDPDKVAHTGMHHSAFEYPSFEDLISTYRRLKAEGILPHMCLDHGMTTSFYYLDPDGNSVELQADNFGDWDRSSEWMRTSAEFADNPVGMFVDPDKLSAALAEGLSPEQIHDRAYGGEYMPAEPPDPRMPLGE